jgi:hypothetical protein
VSGAFLKVARRRSVAERAPANRRLAAAAIAILIAMRLNTRMACCLLCACVITACANSAPIADLSVQPATLSPNADGKDDIARVAYRVTRDSIVSIYLLDAAGQRLDLRTDVARPAQPEPYTLLFNGIASSGRLVKNGAYTLVVESGGVRLTQPLAVENAAGDPPRITELTVDPVNGTMTPNRDAIDDRVYINVGLAGTAKLSVYVLGANGLRQDIQREELARRDNTSDFLDAGRYFYNYDGGIDNDADPPPDGDYMLVAEAVDAVGQRDTVTRTLRIRDSGRPVAEIVAQADRPGISWQGVGENSEVTVKVGDTLRFSTTVSNYGTSPIRTEGPFDPNLCYTLDENRYSKGFAEADGAWRIGVDFETNRGEDHPMRWGVGSLADLDTVQRDGDTLYYLAPGKQVVVRGCVTFNRVPIRNPFRMWGSLIHENVSIATINSRVSPIRVTVVQP